MVLKAKANIEIKQQLRSFKSHNVIGKLDGSDPKLKDEYVIYTAHWDHLGRHPELQGDQIFNGAIDNASGVASVIELAGRVLKIESAAETLGLIHGHDRGGSRIARRKILREHPLYPLEKTLADINIDTVNPWGKSRDIEDLTNGNSTFDDLLGSAATARQGRVMKPNSRAGERQLLSRRSFRICQAQAFLRIVRSGGIEISSANRAITESRSETITLRHHYHQASDEVDPNWDLSGAVQDVQLLFEVGYQVANGDKFPEWRPESEFKAKRDAIQKKSLN